MKKFADQERRLIFESMETGQDQPLRKKLFFPISNALRKYLKTHGREVALPLSYNDLTHFSYSVPILDAAGRDTLWEKALYDMADWNYLRDGLLKLYAIIKTEGDFSFTKHLDLARIDYCAFGNSHPFRIRIVNRFNDNYDHFYIKREDASRVYGLELEDILSPNRISFLTGTDSLIEEHIPGLPGDIYIKKYLTLPETNKIRLAKEFVKFNERCFVRLLGDMRSYNYVVNAMPDIEDFQYRIRAIDFDQQSYEGRRNFYLPQFFKENSPMVDLSLRHLDSESIAQYQAEERTLVAFRLASSRYRLLDLLDIMSGDVLSTEDKVRQLKEELSAHFRTTNFYRCSSMGCLVKQTLRVALKPHLSRIQRNLGKITD